MSAYDWHEDAACKDMEVDVFYPEKGQNHHIRTARQVCGGCPVKARCLTTALSRNAMEDWGVWGGMTKEERDKVRRLGLKVAA